MDGQFRRRLINFLTRIWKDPIPYEQLANMTDAEILHYVMTEIECRLEQLPEMK